MINNVKINNTHLERKAYVYVRQSTQTQILLHQESTQLQYNLRQRAIELGWANTKIEIIDEDQGRSGRSAQHRTGFQRLVSEVSIGQVGIVLMLEASRLARNNSDWYHLMEICSISKVLISDSNTVYDPRDPNDRLLLGIKGTLSEAELFTLRTRLYEGRWNKAKKGKLFFSLPTGYVRDSDGNWDLDPDLQVRERLSYLFQTFYNYGVARRVVYHLRDQGLDLPTRVTSKENYGLLQWKKATFSDVMRILSNPAYAGAYVYGRWTYLSEKRSAKTGKASAKLLSQEQWAVCIHDHHPSYISWEQYMKNKQKLQQNFNREHSPGVAREGAALLQGIVYCGFCGRKMSVQNRAAREKRSPSYMCALAYQDGEHSICQSTTSYSVDAAIVEAFLEAISPLQIEVSIKVLEQLEQNVANERRQWQLQLEQARYEVRIAQRQYDAVDPDNRLVASQLEKRWNEKLERLANLEQAYTKAQEQSNWNITQEQRLAISKLSKDLPAIWKAETTTNRERKELLRYAIEKVHLDGKTEPGQIQIQIHWRSQTITKLKVKRVAPADRSLKTPKAAVELLHQLAQHHTYAEIAEKLNAEGWSTAFGRPFSAMHVGYLCRRDRLGHKKHK